MTHLGCARPQAAPGEDLQTVERSEFTAREHDIVAVYVDPPEQGRVIGQCVARHRHQELGRFLNKINRETPAGLSMAGELSAFIGVRP